MSDAARICQRNMRAWYLARIAGAGGRVGGSEGARWGHLAEGLMPPGSGTVLPFPNPHDAGAIKTALAALDRAGAGQIWSTVGSALFQEESGLALKRLGFVYQFAGLCMQRSGSAAAELSAPPLPAWVDLRCPGTINLDDGGAHPSYGAMSEPAARASLRAANALSERSGDRYDLLGAYRGDRLVASAALFVTETSVGLYDVASLPAHRRQGLAGALIRMAVARAQRQYRDRPLVLQCDVSLAAFYARSGFETCGWIAHWCRSEDPPAQALPTGATGTDLEKLSVAIETGDLKTARAMLDRTPALATKALAGSGAFPLHLAAYRGMRGAAAALISAGADIGQADARFGASPLYWALMGLSERGPVFKTAQLDVARDLIRAGAALGAAERSLLDTLDADLSRALANPAEGGE